MKFTVLHILLSFLLLCACSNPFAPKKHTSTGIVKPPAPLTETPEILMDNLNRAMRDRDKDLYETLLDEDFWFTEEDCQGDIVLENGKEEELEIMGGSRDSDKPGIFDIFITFDFEFRPIKRSRELGPEYPKKHEDDPDGHPDEDWEVFRGRVIMTLLDENGDGFDVDQIMNYKLRLAGDGLWKMIRWIDDPLSGDCGGFQGGAKPISPSISWAAAKNHHRTRNW